MKNEAAKKKMVVPYYQIATDDDSRTASITIYGDITSWPWLESDVSSYRLATKLEGLDADHIDVYINSYGGEVAEALAIYHSLRRHKASVTTYCDGFACSAASIIFCSGDDRIMGPSSLLMIHPASSGVWGNAKDMRKQADDLDKITDASVTAYLAACGDHIDRDTLIGLMDEETWLSPDDAVSYGFATAIDDYTSAVSAPSQSARNSLFEAVFRVRKTENEPKQTQSKSVFSSFLEKKEVK